MFKKHKSKIKGNSNSIRKLITLQDPKSPITEQFRILRTNISFSFPDKQLRTLLVTSSVQQEGKSTISANLAVVFSQTNQRVLFIDADLRKPTVHNTFNLKNAVGLSTLLTSQSQIKDSIQKTKLENLDILTSGPIPPNPAELLESDSFSMLIEELQKVYHLILFDSPPILSVTDSQIISSKVDGSLLVVDKQDNNKNNVKNAKELITVSNNAKLIGIIFNNDEYNAEKYYVYE
ncbi:CpsD/CapB family tyrosine-protein kinase [Macrococcus equipercicus]|uniref:non-specific protein-tyrosine kinase n=1 Tax=Macrococcus equipercicus TaxID=69967 RepID=A0ABQ6R857_9STAP|nr:CpsD/CapB family tyrosine-protein kinase [Macrococcus equipercicus]KAA1039305.1 CpsD/CapB family tyrosine-protein kinase [Macrococcus equipercicus]